MVAVRTIPAACTSLSYSIEETLTQLPSAPIWKLLDPTSYTGEFGANVEYMVDETIGSGRAPKKGEPVGKAVPAGYEMSLRQNWLQPFLPGIMFNLAIETANTNTFNRISSSATLATVTGTGYTGTNFTEANKWKVTDTPLLIAQGFTNAANNGLKKLSAVTATSLTADGTVAALAVDNGSLEVCGVEISATNSNLTVAGNEFTIIASQLGTGKTLEPQPGTFIHLGGDGAATQYASTGNINTGWARVVRTVPNGIVCDLATFTPTTTTGNTNKVHVYLPTRVYKDQVMCDNKFRTTYQLERRLGHSDTTNPAEQSQIVIGAVANQLDLAMPTKSKVMATLNFVGAESYRRTGANTTTQAPWSGANRRPNDKTGLFNMSTDLKYGVLYRHDKTSSALKSIFGLVLDGTVTINNNCTPIEGWGVYGAYEINTGKLDISANLTALFTDVAALDLAEEGVDAGLFIAFGSGNNGFVLDCPLMTVQASPLEIAINTPIKISLSNIVNESAFGYASSLQFFDYLPTIATARKVA